MQVEMEGGKMTMGGKRTGERELGNGDSKHSAIGAALIEGNSLASAAKRLAEVPSLKHI